VAVCVCVCVCACLWVLYGPWDERLTVGAKGANRRGQAWCRWLNGLLHRHVRRRGVSQVSAMRRYIVYLHSHAAGCSITTACSSHMDIAW